MAESRTPLFFIIRIALGLVLGVLALRIFHFTDLYSSTLIIMDKWHTMDPLFYHQSWWEGFSLQHGPHRLGIIYFIFKTNAFLSNWDNRWDMFTQAGVYVLSALLALGLKQKLFGKLSWSDLIIPLIFLTPHAATTMINNPFVHGLVPAFALTLCFIYLQPNGVWRTVTLSIFAFLAAFSGFAFILIPTIVSIEAFLLFKNKPRKWWQTIPSLIAISSFAYIFITNVPKSSWESYPLKLGVSIKYALALIGNIFLSQPKDSYLIWTGFFLIAFLIILILTIKKKGISLNDPKQLSLWILFSSTAIFWVLNIYGRAHLSVGNAHASRYVPLGMSFALGIYFTLLMIPQKWLKTTTLLALGFLLLRAQKRTEGRVNFVAERSAYYQEVTQCLLEDHTFEECQGPHFDYIHPAPKRAKLQEKLDFLKENHLNIWAVKKQP